MNALATNMNFEFNVIPPSDGHKWGKEIEPGVYSGIVGELQKQNADVVWADFYVMLDRSKYIDYTHPYTIAHFCYMVRCIFIQYN